jgi:hypothetical protein
MPHAFSFALALLPAVVAALAAWLTSTRQARRVTRREEYSAFISAISGMVSFEQGTPERKNYDRLSIEAKARIILHCGERVLEALAAFQKSTTLEEVNSNYCKLIEEMRLDVGGNDVPNFLEFANSIMIVQQGVSMPNSVPAGD